MRSKTNWIITEDGIDGSKGAQDPEYFIHKERLLETTYRLDRTLLYDWPVHLSEKSFMTKDVIQELLGVFEKAVEEFGLELDMQTMSNTKEYIKGISG